MPEPSAPSAVTWHESSVLASCRGHGEVHLTEWCFQVQVQDILPCCYHTCFNFTASGGQARGRATTRQRNAYERKTARKDPEAIEGRGEFERKLRRRAILLSTKLSSKAGARAGAYFPLDLVPRIIGYTRTCALESLLLSATSRAAFPAQEVRFRRNVLGAAADVFQQCPRSTRHGWGSTFAVRLVFLLWRIQAMKRVFPEASFNRGQGLLSAM